MTHGLSVFGFRSSALIYPSNRYYLFKTFRKALSFAYTIFAMDLSGNHTRTATFPGKG